MAYDPTKSKMERAATLHSVVPIYVFIAYKCWLNLPINCITKILTFTKL